MATIRKSLDVHTSIEMLRAINKNSESKPSPLRLTPRGTEVFELIIKGLSDKRIGEHLGMSYSGVRRHREKMLLCNNCASMRELIAKYYGRDADAGPDAILHR